MSENNWGIPPHVSDAAKVAAIEAMLITLVVRDAGNRPERVEDFFAEAARQLPNEKGFTGEPTVADAARARLREIQAQALNELAAAQQRALDGL